MPRKPTTEKPPEYILVGAAAVRRLPDNRVMVRLFCGKGTVSGKEGHKKRQFTIGNAMGSAVTVEFVKGPTFVVLTDDIVPAAYDALLREEAAKQPEQVLRKPVKRRVK